MKALIPSHKENKRYLLLKGKNLKKNVPLSIKEFIGVLGFSKASPMFIESKDNSAILSVNSSSLDEVKASFAIFKEKIEILSVSGTLKKLRSSPKNI